MCRISVEHSNMLRSYALAALHLWESGQKKPAAWLLRRQGVEWRDWRLRHEAREIFAYELRPIYEYMERQDRKGAAKQDASHVQPSI